MAGRLATALLLLVLPARFAAAQDTPSGGGDFCATAPQELLAALDGSWSFTQGRGMAITGGPAVPLPAHPPVRMGLEYNSEGGYAILSGQGQQMLMLPTATETASGLLGGLYQNFVTSTEGMDACDWYALPTLVGTNAYDLSGHFGPPSGNPDGKNLSLCYDGDHYIFNYEVGLYNGVIEEIVLKKVGSCDDRDWVDGGDMTMTIALKFDSPSSARGMLSFSGKHGGYRFAAWAPITMSR